MNKLAEWALRFAASKLDGKKAYIGATGEMLTGFGAMVTGIVGVLGTLYPDTGLPAIELTLAWTSIIGGVYGISSGFKSFGQRAATAKVEAQIAEIPKQDK